jgi:FKBP-type peptidyl-prolyl cis-trans isomerase SlpA
MRIAQQGDRVLVHYVKHLENGAVQTSRGRGPLEITIGIDNPRLPGLGLKLVGLAPGEETRLTVPPERAYGKPDPGRIHRWSRARFPAKTRLQVGQWVKFTDPKGHRRRVRILKLSPKGALVDTNHPFAGQWLNLEIELVAIYGGPLANRKLDADRIRRVVAFDADAASLAALRKAFPHWEVQQFDDTCLNSLVRNWQPGAADLLVVGIGKNAAETLGLCRFLVFCTDYSEDSRREKGLPERHTDGDQGTVRIDAPLLVLVPRGEEALIKASLEAGAHSCLMLPIHFKDVRRMFARSKENNRPGRHTLNLQQPQREDAWRDGGGEA